jgi:transcriptional regulator of met regulon
MAVEKEIIIDVESAKANKSLAKLTDAIKDVNKEAEKTNKETAKGLDNLDDSANKTSKGIGGLSKGFKGLGIAMKAAGIGLVIAVVAKLTQAFSQNQKVVDAVSSVFNGISIVFSEVTNAVISAYEAASEATGGFDALGKVLGGLLTLYLTPFKLAFYEIKLAIQGVQLIWEKSPFGDNDQATIKKLNENIKQTKQNLIDIGTEALKAGKDIYDNFSEAIDEVGALTNETVEQVSKVNVKAAIEQGKALTEARKAAQIAQVEIQGLIEKYDRQAEVQRQIRDDERLSIDERIKANDELGRVLEEQLKAQLALANQRVKSAELEIKATGDNTENQVALKEALNEVEAVEASITGFKSEQRVNEAALQKERRDAINAQLESESKLSIERKRFNAEQIEDEVARLEALKQIDLLEAEQEAARLQAIVDNANAGTQAKIDAQIALDDFIEESRQRNIERDKELSEARINNAETEAKLSKLREQQKLGDAKNTFDQVAQLAGKDSKIGKAFAIASATISGIEGVQSAYSTAQKSPITTFFPGYPILQAGLAGAVAAKNIAAIKSIDSSGRGSSSVASSTSAAPAPPQFNIVGQDSNNQLAQTIAQQENEPVQAYVVANDVTTAQSLNNNIVEGATL